MMMFFASLALDLTIPTVILVGAMALDWPQLAAGLSDAERTQQTAAFKFPEREGAKTETFNTARMHLPMIDLAKAAGAPDTAARGGRVL